MVAVARGSKKWQNLIGEHLSNAHKLCDVKAYILKDRVSENLLEVRQIVFEPSEAIIPCYFGVCLPKALHLF